MAITPFLQGHICIVDQGNVSLDINRKEMFKGITWSAFITTVLIIAATYWVIVLLIFYRKKIRSLFFSPGGVLEDEDEQEWLDVDAGYGSEDGDRDEEILESLLNEVRSGVLEVAGKGARKSELLVQISRQLANYSGLRRASYRYAVNHFIIEQAESICGVVFSVDELNEEWDTLLR